MVHHGFTLCSSGDDAPNPRIMVILHSRQVVSSCANVMDNPAGLTDGSHSDVSSTAIPGLSPSRIKPWCSSCAPKLVGRVDGPIHQRIGTFRACASDTIIWI